MTNNVEMSKTESKLRAALQRLIDEKPTHRELKRKLKDNKLKIIVSNVEKEAGFTNGAIKPSRYQKLREDIESAERKRLYGDESDVADEVVRRHPLYIKVDDDLAKAKAEIKKLKLELASKNSKLDGYKDILKEQAVRMHQMNVAMWSHIPEDKKHVDIMLDVQGIGSESNVLSFKEREKK